MVKKVTKDTPVVVKQREALGFKEMLDARQVLGDCTIDELATKLDRPKLSVYARWNTLAKICKNQGKVLKPLKRKVSSRKNVDVSALSEKYADVMSDLE